MLTITIAATACILASAGPSRDFVCGSEVELFCGHLPRNQTLQCLKDHRYELERECLEHVVEDESLECGFVIGAECGDVVRDRKLFVLCLEQNQDRLKKICPNTFYDRYDEEINAHCGFDIAECCAKKTGGCKGDANRANLEACIKDLASPASKDRYIGCDAAILEQLNFRCGVAVESVCGKFERDAFAFIECIEREVPCPDKKSMLS